MVYFCALICPFSTKALLGLHGFLLTRLFFQSLKKPCKQRTPCTFHSSGISLKQQNHVFCIVMSHIYQQNGPLFLPTINICSFIFDYTSTRLLAWHHVNSLAQQSWVVNKQVQRSKKIAIKSLGLIWMRNEGLCMIVTHSSISSVVEF